MHAVEDVFVQRVAAAMLARKRTLGA